MGLTLKPRSGGGGSCPQGAETCSYCRRPVLFRSLEARVRDPEHQLDGAASPSSCCKVGWFQTRQSEPEKIFL